MLDRRTLLGRAALLGAATVAAGPASAFQAHRVSIFDVLQKDVGGRLGVAALDTGNGQRLVYNAMERFALCSTAKLPLAAAVLAASERGSVSLDKEVAYSEGDLLAHSPVTKAHLAQGKMTVGALIEAMLLESDNAAFNLLLPQIGGPRGATRFLQQTGDRTTRIDRPEPALNEVKDDDPRDTTTPLAMVELMQKVLLGSALDPADQHKLIGWMVECKTGLNRLRAGLPKDWKVGDKTGTGPNGEVNDVAIAIPPGRKPILIACYIDAPNLPPAKADAVQSQVGALVGSLFANG